MSVLSDRDIRREIQNGNIVLYNPDGDCQGNIQNCSVDITLGKYYYRNTKNIPFFNPWSEKHVKEYWGNVKEADICTNATAAELDLKVGDEYILVNPNESILAHTQEFIGGSGRITTMLKARSSLGRCGISICRDAGWGDIGFRTRYTLEITNHSTCPVVLPVGSRVGQIVFLYTGIPDSTYRGKYQTGETLEEIVQRWDPTMLLPKAYLDGQPKH